MGRIKKGCRMAGIFILLVILVQVGRYFFMDQERAARHWVYTQVKATFVQAAEKQAAGYGLKPFVPGLASGSITARKIPRDRPVVVLVHGLDDPGVVWMNLAPALVENNFYVLIMTYPNDQSITASARLVCDHLGAFFLKEKIAPAAIVTHSMGGLVIREMLTSPDLDYGRRVEAQKVPLVQTLIMVAPPNHGSHLARFRLLMEVRDQVHQWLKKDYHWLTSLLDGAGEGGLDLIPGSRFLTQLNRRPLPENLNIQVIAGQASPWSEAEILARMSRVEKALPRELAWAARPLVQAGGKALASLVHALGDGLVSQDSARLDGVDVTLVQGTHLTMIRTLSAHTPKIPRAIPVILSMLTP